MEQITKEVDQALKHIQREKFKVEVFYEDLKQGRRYQYLTREDRPGIIPGMVYIHFDQCDDFRGNHLVNPFENFLREKEVQIYEGTIRSKDWDDSIDAKLFAPYSKIHQVSDARINDDESNRRVINEFRERITRSGRSVKIIIDFYHFREIDECISDDEPAQRSGFVALKTREGLIARDDGMCRSFSRKYSSVFRTRCFQRRSTQGG